jgi:integrase
MTFATFLSEKIERYIELRRSLGYAFDKQAGTLRAFAHHVERSRRGGPATRTMAQDFVLSFRGAANSRAVRHGVLRRFYEFLALYDARTESLERKAFHRSRAIPPPRLVSDAELASLIRACRLLSPGLPLVGSTMATLIGLLASTGLRSGEAVRLDRGDVDLTRGVILIRKTKFRKDRLVTLAALRRYAHARDAAFPAPVDAGFFLSSRGCRLSAAGLQCNFVKARKHASLDDGKPLRPHDLRHRFAVTRLRLWHQQRADVQALLPLLATYLGHTNYSDTAYYLTGSSDLLAVPAERAFTDGGAA